MYVYTLNRNELQTVCIVFLCNTHWNSINLTFIISIVFIMSLKKRFHILCNIFMKSNKLDFNYIYIEFHYNNFSIYI